MQTSAQPIAVNAEEQMRADLYSLLGKILFFTPDKTTLENLAGLQGDDTEMGKAFNTLANLSSKMNLQEISEEYNDLFIGMGRGELLPYGSYYLTGFLNEKPLAKLRNSMRELGIERDESIKEPEDHIGRLFEMMSNMIVGNYGKPMDLQTQKTFYETHIEPWAEHFFKDLEAAKNSRFYQPVGTIGRLFVEIETNAFSME